MEKILLIEIKGRKYEIRLKTGNIYEYVFEQGSEEDGDIEGWELVGKVLQ